MLFRLAAVRCCIFKNTSSTQILRPLFHSSSSFSSPVVALSSTTRTSPSRSYSKHAKRNVKKHNIRQAQQSRDATLRKEGRARNDIIRARIRAKHDAAVDDILLECERLGLRNHLFAEQQAELVASKQETTTTSAKEETL